MSGWTATIFYVPLTVFEAFLWPPLDTFSGFSWGMAGSMSSINERKIVIAELVGKKTRMSKV